MSNYLAVGGVSLTLKTLLADRMAYTDPALAGSKASVSVSPPDVEAEGSPRINLFLYHVSENQFLKNQEIPGQGVRGAYGMPPLSLDLHYLLTAYGGSANDESEAHMVLADAMQVLHDTPVITESMLQVRDSNPHQPMLDASLRGEFEQVRITLQPFGLEDSTKLWSALSTHYRLSVAYKVSVVQIDSQRARRFPQPVRERRVFGVPFRRPEITDISPLMAGIGETLTLRGNNLGGSDVRIKLGDVTFGVTPTSDREIAFAIPDDALLQPGPIPVEVLAGVKELPQAAFRSNLAVFVLVPQVGSITPTSGPTGSSLTIIGNRLFNADATTLVLIGDQSIPSSAFTTSSPTQIAVPMTGLTAGTYRVRVRVNGAESREDSFAFQVT